MIIRCTKCSTEFALDPSQVGPEGVTLRCSVCSHMFHAEPDPDAVSAPWKLATVEKHLFTLPDLRRVLEHIEDGRLRPEDQISRTGQAWLKLGEMPEFSSLFIGAEGLPRVFKAAEASPVTDLGPPPAFGAGIDDVRREETVRFNLNTLAGATRSAGRAQAERAPDFDPLPAPPEFDTPVSRRGRAPGVPDARAFGASPSPSSMGESRGGRPAPASMLEAVTNAVADDRGRAADVPESGEASRSRSQPILVADLARAAAASAEKAVQAVDGQRARERAERSTGTFTGAMSRVEPPRPVAASAVVNASREVVRPEVKPALRRDSERRPAATSNASAAATAAANAAAVTAATARMAEASAVAAVVAATPVMPAAPATPTPTPTPTPRVVEPTPVHAVEPASAVTADLSRPAEVIVRPEPRRGNGMLWALLGVAAAVGIVFGVPGIRERVFNGGATPVTRAPTEPVAVPAKSDLPTQELAQARTAMRNLGLKESNKVEAALQRVIDDPARSPEAKAQARLAAAELVLMRALACKIAATIEPTALGGQAQTRAAEDPVQAADLLAAVGPTADPDQLRRVQALQALVAGQPPGELPPGSEELAALIKGAGLWRGEVRSPPAGLITSLQRLANPSTLSQSVLALALWRSGDIDGAQALLRGIIERISDQPAASTILEAIDRQNLVNENGDPEVAVPPSDPEPQPVDPQPVDPQPVDPQPDTKGGPVVRPPVGPNTQERAEVMVSTGCQKVKQGDTAGIKLLLEAVDRHPDTLRNFNLCFCLGTGFARQDSHDAALTWYKRALSLSPSNRDAVAGAARSAELLGRTTEALGYFKRLHNIDPGNAAANAYLSKHDSSPEPAPQPAEEPGELLPIKRKNQ